MSTIQLTDDMQVDASQIASVKREKKGDKITSGAISGGTGEQDLSVGQDVLLVRLQDGSELAVRGEKKRRRRGDQLQKAKREGSLTFALE